MKSQGRRSGYGRVDRMIRAMGWKREFNTGELCCRAHGDEVA